jgi:hypothetical protein
MTSLPEGSRIQTKFTSEGELYVLPCANSRAMRYLIGLFILFWLVAWAFGWVSAFKQISKGGGESIFLIGWLGAWTVGGLGAVYFAYRLWRPGVPETLLMRYDSLQYDSGLPVFIPQFKYNPKDFWKDFFRKRIKVSLSRDALSTLALRETSEGNRLTIDFRSKRIEIGLGLEEPEREWLYQFIKQKYKVSQINQGGGE